MAGRGARGRVACVACWALLLVGCGGPVNMSMSGGGEPMGDAIEVPPRPSDAECETAIRDAVPMALQAREMLGPQAIEATIEAADRAARAPDADLSTYGIPLLPAEVAALRAAGVAPDPMTPMGAWVGSQPGILNAVMLDGDVLVVGVDVPDDNVLALTRCFELAAFDGLVEYRFARPSRAVLEQLRVRIQGDRAALAADGIAVTDVWVDEQGGSVVIELARMTEASGSMVIERYGSATTVTGDNGMLGR